MKQEPQPRRSRILIVDDSDKMRDYLHEALKTLPAEIFEAENGMDALTLIEQQTPDLLITDYMMPAWDGLEVCRQVRKQPGLKDIKILMVTGQLVDRPLLQAVNFRLVDAALVKPVSQAELQQLCRHLLGLGAPHCNW